MPRSRKEKRQHNDSAPEQRARVIKAGGYNGSGSSRDFMVSGHSTGSQNSEMEALSHQVSIDAGKVPDYPIDYSLSDGGFEVSRTARSKAKTEVQAATEEGGITLGKIALGVSVGALGGALSYLAYRYYSNSSDSNPNDSNNDEASL